MRGTEAQRSALHERRKTITIQNKSQLIELTGGVLISSPRTSAVLRVSAVIMTCVSFTAESQRSPSYAKNSGKPRHYQLTHRKSTQLQFGQQYNFLVFVGANSRAAQNKILKPAPGSLAGFRPRFHGGLYSTLSTGEVVRGQEYLEVLAVVGDRRQSAGDDAEEIVFA